MIHSLCVRGGLTAPISRRRFLRMSLTAGTALAMAGTADQVAAAGTKPSRRVPLIDCTDLYHPHQDVGDNFDIVAAYALPEIDLRAVVLDATEKYREPPEGPRDPGFIPVLQLNSIFGRDVPAATTPFRAMKAPDDRMTDAPAFQQFGIELLFRTLRQSADPVDITVFGAARAVAVAFNREPDLLRRRVRRIHLCAGASSPDFVEWNVALDPHAIVCLLRSDLPIAVYPCATKDGPFAYGPHNCFWKLPDLRFVNRMHPRLRSYLAYAFGQSKRVDFLRAMEDEPPRGFLDEIGKRPHNVWETAVWMQLSDRRLVRRADGTCRIVPSAEAVPSDKVFCNELRPCRIQVRDSGTFTFELTDAPTNFLIYDRGDPHENEKLLREALPSLYLSFHP